MPRLPRQRLRGFEKFAVPLLEQLNSRPVAKSLIQHTLNEFNARWIMAAMSPVLQVYNPDVVTRLDAPRGLLLVANHLSFFDMYVAASWMQRNTDLVHRVYFPVRANYFYDRPAGMLINLAISGGSMWPPVFRDSDRRDLNDAGMAQLRQTLGAGAIIGFHPEGQRNKSMDPWTLAPHRPGVGRLILDVHPDVAILPYFIIGLSNRFDREIRRGYLPVGQRGTPVRMHFGTPSTAGDLQPLGDAARITDTLMNRVASLAATDRSMGPWASL
jgi:1-acyl-sn-glycerol-3-phosphate acyltransferase